MCFFKKSQNILFLIRCNISDLPQMEITGVLFCKKKMYCVRSVWTEVCASYFWHFCFVIELEETSLARFCLWNLHETLSWEFSGDLCVLSWLLVCKSVAPPCTVPVLDLEPCCMLCLCCTLILWDKNIVGRDLWFQQAVHEKQDLLTLMGLWDTCMRYH